MSDYQDCWATRERMRGRHAEDRDNPLQVTDLLMRTIAEGRPLHYTWPEQDMTGQVHDEPDAPTGLLPKIPADNNPVDHVADVDTEPTTATREARTWLTHEDFSSWPQALAG